MKHLTISLSILLALLLFCFGSSALVRTCTLKTADMLTAASENTLTAEEKLTAMQQAADYWRNHLGLLDSLLRHDEADEVQENFVRMLSYQRNSEDAEASSTCAALILRLTHIAEMELPSYYNLLTSPPEFYSIPA